MQDEKIYSKLLKQEDLSAWNEFVKKSPWTTILQHSAWGETKASEGWEPNIIGVFRGDDLILGAMTLLKPASFLGNYLYVPHGPVFLSKEDLKQGLEALIFHLRNFAIARNCFSIEIEPMLGIFPEAEPSENMEHYADTEILDAYKRVGFKATDRNMQPRYKLFYDLELSEDELMGLMKKNTRYNVRYAEKKGVKVQEYKFEDPQAEDILKKFYSLLEETSERAGGYPIRPYSTFASLFHAFKGMECLSLFEAKYEEDVIKINISQKTNFWSSSFYAGSNRLHAKLNAPYLLRWASVLAAKRDGCKIYDFWGFIPGDTQHEGYSNTKLSFGGTRMDTYGLLALPLNKTKYFIWDKLLPLRSKLFEYIRKLKK